MVEEALVGVVERAEVVASEVEGLGEEEGVVRDSEGGEEGSNAVGGEDKAP